MMKRLPFAAAIALSVVSAVRPARADDAPVKTHYAGYFKGFNLFDIDLETSLRPAAYRMRLSFKLVGALGALFHADGAIVVDGRFAGSRAIPREVYSSGQVRGTPHVTQIDWRDDTPQVVQMVPPPEDGREPVPDSERAHTIDTLSAIAVLLHQAAETGACDAETRTFDGERLSEFSAHAAGQETLPPTERSSFQGQAMRCDVMGRMTGGFMKNANRAKLAKWKRGTAWLTRLAPGQPLVPVRITFYSDAGDPTITLYLAHPSDSP